MAYRTIAIITIAGVLTQAAAAATGQTCPQPLRDARRLVLVTAGGMGTSAATVQLFRRSAPQDRWRPLGSATPARLGRAGMAWGEAFHGLARNGEPIKVEGDRRTPAGAYRIGHSFGFTPSRHRGYLQLTAQAVCVDDVKSPAYNTITSQRAVGPGVHVERMRAVQHYRQGLAVDYPTNAAARAGSCIFIHVWRSPNLPTNGCVALPEERVKALQDFAAPGAVLAVLPQGAADRLSGCLPAAAEGVN